MDEQQHVFAGRLEVCQRRSRSPKLRGSFRYGVDGIVSDRAARRKIRIAPGAFDFVLKAEPKDYDVFCLSGHSYDRAFSSRRTGALTFTDGPDELSFISELPTEGNRPSWMQDVLMQIENGQAPVGISPAFIVPPPDRVPNASRIETEPGTGSLIEIFQDIRLTECSVVTLPRFPGTEVAVQNNASPADKIFVDLEGWRKRLWR